MCRLYGFRSAIDSSVHHSLVAAENALAAQSARHGDGWGLAYYVNNYPHLIRNDQRALSDSLFREVSAVVATRTFLAHIRKATIGEIGVLNCHPSQQETVRRRVAALVDERYQRYLLGSTDSEVCFYAFLSRLARRVEDVQSRGVSAEHAVCALRETVERLFEAAPVGADGEPSLLTFLLTNGNLMLGYRNGKELFFSTYKQRCPERETCYAFEEARCEREVTDGIVKHLIVTSERLELGHNVWQELDNDELVVVGHGMGFKRQRLLG
jgi:glutamine amidotransferase